MKYLSYWFCILLLLGWVLSCTKDSGPEPVRDLGVQTPVDDEVLVNYLQSHFYNYEDFENDPNNHKIEIRIDTIADDNANKISLWDQIETKTIELNDKNGNKVPNKMYFLIVREGVGESPSQVDSTFVTYKGTFLNRKVFDSRELPLWFDLTQVIRGFRVFLPELKAGNHTLNNDGTYDLDNYGQGMFFVPSALGYYGQDLLSIPKYSPLVFSVALHKVNPADHDNDGILSIDEDPDGDGNPLNDDTDEDRIPNYRDADDDGDGTLTKKEYDRDLDGVADDNDNDGTPDYLDQDNN
jgi:FKBP-type peptidyl-prolyl cis-trans isomerase FkpA